MMSLNDQFTAIGTAPVLFISSCTPHGATEHTTTHFASGKEPVKCHPPAFRLPELRKENVMRIHRIGIAAVLAAMLVLTVLPTLSFGQNTTPAPTPSTWGAIKAMYGVNDVASQTPKFVGPGTNSIGSYMSIAWPFVNQNPDLWRGDEDERTLGGSIYACGGTRMSHTGAEYYARDLSRPDGATYGQPVGAGINGRVVVAGWQSGYGNTVVIYDAAARRAVRYAHLQYVSVSYNQNVAIRQKIGAVGNSGCTPCGAHLHLVGFTNIDHFQRNGDPCIPTLCDNDYYACAVYFFC